MNELITVNTSDIIESQPLSELLLELWETYIDVRPKRKSTYKKVIKQFLVYINDNGIAQTVREDVILWRENLQAYHDTNISNRRKGLFPLA